MASKTWQDVSAKPASGGIDSYSSKAKIGETFVEDAINMVGDASGKWSTRQGYENYFGWMPLRVRRFVQNGTAIKLYFDTSTTIDLAQTGQGPLIVYGYLPAPSIDYGTSSFSGTATGKYFASYTLESRETLTAPSGTVTRTASDTGITSKYVFLGLNKSDSTTDVSNTTLEVSDITIDPLSFEISVNYVVASSEEAFFLYKEKASDAGSVYHYTAQSTNAVVTADNYDFMGDLGINAASYPFVDGDAVRFTSTGTLPTGLVAGTTYYIIDASGTRSKVSATLAGPAIAYTDAGTGTITCRKQGQTFTISAATHNLNNFRLGVRVFDETTGNVVEVVPESLTISLTGTVSFTISDSIDGFAILTTVPLANTYSSSAVLGTNTITISGPPSAYCFYYVYYYDAGTTLFTSVVPQSISYDATTDSTSIVYVLAAASETVEIYYEEATTVSNILALTDTGSATLDFTNPSLTVWGIGHQDIYKAGTLRGGWANELDNYKSSLTERLVAGLGGCFYSATPIDEASASALMPANYANLRARTSAEYVCAPLFSTASTARTRGSVYDASIVDYMALTTDVTYVSTGLVDITLSFTAKTGAITLGASVYDIDKLTISGMGDSRNNGTFVIDSIVSDSATETIIRVANSAAVDTTIEESGMMGRSGVFTDILGFSTDTTFIGGDSITYEGTATVWPVVGLYDANEILIETTELSTFSSGILIYGTRTSPIIPIRDNASVATVENYVSGDSIVTEYVANKPVVLNVNTNASAAVTIAVASGVATVTFGAAHVLSLNGKIFLYQDTTNTLNGTHTITSIPDTTSVLFATTAADGSYSAYLLGDCIELDETLEWWDSGSVTSTYVVGRWFPIDAPSRDVSTQILDTAYQYFDASTYSEQEVVSSTVMGDTMYFTNGNDDIMKYDGTNIYDAGLLRTIPSVFMNLDTSVQSIQAGQVVSYSGVSVTGKYFTIASDAFAVGDRVYDSTTSTVYLVVDKQLVPGATDTYNIIVSGSTASLSGTGTLTKVKRFRYYIRFNMIDRNENVIASAAANSGDMYFDLYTAGRVMIKCSSYPIAGFADYERIEMEIYKTISDTSAPFYLTKRIALDMTYTSPVVPIVYDDLDDEYLAQLDTVNSALLGQEIGTGWQPPYKANIITTADNSLIIGDLKSWPRFDITMKPTSTSVTASTLSGLKWLFRKDSDNTSTTSDFEAVQSWEYVTTGAVTLPFTGTFTFASGDVTIGTGNIAKTAHGLLTGSSIRLAGASLPVATSGGGLSAATTYYVIYVDANNFKLARTREDAVANTPILYSNAGAGTNTLTSSGWQSGTQFYSPAHGLVTNNWIYLFYASVTNNQPNTFCGWFQVGRSDADNFYLLGGGAAGSQTFGTVSPNRYVTATVKTDIPVWLGTDGNYQQVNGNIVGSAELVAARRLADAINFTMVYSQYNTKTAYLSFRPWLTAYAGADYGVGQIVVENQITQTDYTELLMGTVPSGLGIFVNGLSRISAEQISSQVTLYPSRIGISFKNYPEIFDSLDASPTQSLSVVDINPADGQGLTAAVPFFGTSTFGAANLNQVVAVFKANSIYVLDVRTRQYQKIDSRGIGCTAPHTVTPVKDGIMFVNKGGIYKLTRDMQVVFVGRMMRGKWKELVDSSALDVACASHWGDKRLYEVYLPPVTNPGTGDNYPTQAFVYQYDNEEVGIPGAWTRFTNVNAIIGCNQEDNNFFGSVDGCVYQYRNYGTAVDYRDGVDAISSTLLFRADDFGAPGARKSVLRTTIQLDTIETDIAAAAIYTATNLSSSFTLNSRINITTAEESNPVVQCSPNDKKGVFFQVKLVHNVMDEKLVITGLSYTVNLLTFNAVKQAADFGGNV